MGWSTPEFEGELQADAPADTLDRVARRVQQGNFPSVGGSRQRYAIVEPDDAAARGDYRAARGAQRLRIVAKDWSTRLAIGLNDVELRLDPRGRLSYRVSFREWARFPMWMAIGFSSLTLVVALVLAFVLPAYVPTGGWIGIASGLFWGGVWPWLLAGILVTAHKKIAARVLEQFLHQAIAEGARTSSEGDLHVALRERANAVLAVLASRHVAMTAEERERVLRCSDPEVLERWLGRAAIASAINDVFDERRARVASVPEPEERDPEERDPEERDPEEHEQEALKKGLRR